MAYLNDFLAHVKKEGIAQTNRFLVFVALPNAVMDHIRNSGDDWQAGTFTTSEEFGSVKRLDTSTLTLSLMAQSVTIPGYNISAVDYSPNATTRKIPFDRQTGELDIVFTCTQAMTEKRIFDAWIETIFHKNHRVEYYDNIIGACGIQVVDRMDDVVYDVELSECYPITITPLQLDRAAQNQILTFQVTFAYHKINPSKERLFKGNASLPAAPTPPEVTVPSVDENYRLSLPELERPDPQALGAITIWKSIDRIKREMDAGLDPVQGAKLMAKVIRDAKAAMGVGYSGDVIDQMTDYVSKITSIVGNFSK